MGKEARGVGLDSVELGGVRSIVALGANIRDHDLAAPDAATQVIDVMNFRERVLT